LLQVTFPPAHACRRKVTVLPVLLSPLQACRSTLQANANSLRIFHMILKQAPGLHTWLKLQEMSHLLQVALMKVDGVS
jgi:hypothetical protein